MSNNRWIVGGKVGLVVNYLGQVIGWVMAPAESPRHPVPPTTNRSLRKRFHHVWLVVQGFRERIIRNYENQSVKVKLRVESREVINLFSKEMRV